MWNALSQYLFGGNKSSADNKNATPKKHRKRKNTARRLAKGTSVNDGTIDLTQPDSAEKHATNNRPAKLRKVELTLLAKLNKQPSLYIPSLKFSAKKGFYYSRPSASKHKLSIFELVAKTGVESAGRLKDGEWLGSFNFDHFGAQLEKLYPDFHLLSDSFIQGETLSKKLQSDSKNRFLNVQRAQLENVHRSFICGNEGDHWYSYLLDISSKRNITIYATDSLGWLTEDSESLVKCKQLVKALYPKARIKVILFETPNQGNAVDCGVACCMLMEQFAKGNFNQQMIQSLAAQKEFDYGPYRQQIAAISAMSEKGLAKLKL